MTRTQLEHLVRASASVTGERDLVVIGSQAILGEHPDAPKELLLSNEADMYPMHDTRKSILIDGALGLDSPFHDMFGYYADGVDQNTSILPTGWESRLVGIRSEGAEGATAWCLETHDLAIAKYVAGREKDRRFTRYLAEHGLTEQTKLRERLGETPVSPETEERIKAVMDGEFRSLRRVQSIAGRLGSYRRRFPEGEVQSVVHEQGMDVQWIVERGGQRVYTAGTVRDCREVALVMVHGAEKKREDLLVLERLIENRHREQLARLRTVRK